MVQDGNVGHGWLTVPFAPVNRRPNLQIVAPGASEAEAAAVIAALEQFMRDTAPPPPAPAGPRMSAWERTGLLEGTNRDEDGLSAWGDGQPWGA